MVATLHDINSYLSHGVLTLVGVIPLVSTLCLVASFFLIVVMIGTASTGVYALTGRWHRRRGRQRWPARRRDLDS